MELLAPDFSLAVALAAGTRKGGRPWLHRGSGLGDPGGLAIVPSYKIPPPPPRPLERVPGPRGGLTGGRGRAKSGAIKRRARARWPLCPLESARQPCPDRGRRRRRALSSCCCCCCCSCWPGPRRARRDPRRPAPRRTPPASESYGSATRTCWPSCAPTGAASSGPAPASSAPNGGSGPAATCVRASRGPPRPWPSPRRRACTAPCSGCPRRCPGRGTGPCRRPSGGSCTCGPTPPGGAAARTPRTTALWGPGAAAACSLCARRWTSWAGVTGCCPRASCAWACAWAPARTCTARPTRTRRSRGGCTACGPTRCPRPAACPPATRPWCCCTARTAGCRCAPTRTSWPGPATACERAPARAPVAIYVFIYY